MIGWRSMIAWNFHPASGSKTITFNLSTGEELMLADLFEPESGFLDTLSYLCINDIVDQENMPEPDEYLLEGASPMIENFKNFSLSKKSLIIYFDVYKAASYGNAPGGYIVSIPYNKLRGVLKKTGPLASFIK
jgi:hypothetical protein